MGSNIKSRSASKVALESFDDLFGGSAAQENGVEQICIGKKNRGA